MEDRARKNQTKTESECIANTFGNHNTNNQKSKDI